MENKIKIITSYSKDLFDIISNAHVIKIWPGQYRVYADNALVFINYTKDGTPISFSDQIGKDGFNNIAIPENARAAVSKAVLSKFAESYKIPLQQAIALRNSRNK